MLPCRLCQGSFLHQVGCILGINPTPSTEEVMSGELGTVSGFTLHTRELQRVDQTVFGEHGNCHSACLSMVTGVPLEEIPNFAELARVAGDPNVFSSAQLTWLAARGWAIVSIVAWQGLPWPPKFGVYIAGGVSPRGFRHSVVYLNGALWHDPSPTRAGIESVDEVDLLYPLRPYELFQGGMKLLG